MNLTDGHLPTLIFRPSRPTSRAGILLTPNLHATDGYSSLLHYLCETTGYTFALPSLSANVSVPVDIDELNAFREQFFDAQDLPTVKQILAEHVRWLTVEAAANAVTVVGIDSGADVVVESTSDLIRAAADANTGLSLVAVEPVVPPTPAWMQRVARHSAGAFLMSSDRKVVSAYRPVASALADALGGSPPVALVAFSGRRGLLEPTSDAFALDATTDALVGLLHCLTAAGETAGLPPAADQDAPPVAPDPHAEGMAKLHALRALRRGGDWKGLQSDPGQLRMPSFWDMVPEARYNPRPAPIPQRAE